MIKTLLPRNMRLGDVSRHVWRVDVPVGTTLEEALASEFWVHVEGKLNRYDKIELVHEDGSFYAEALVVRRATEKAPVKLSLLFEHRLSATSSQTVTPERKTPVLKADDIPADVEVKHHPKAGWRVLRRSDGAELSRHGTRDDAIAWAVGRTAEAA